MSNNQRVAEAGSLKAKIDNKDSNHDLFKAKPGSPPLQVSRVWERVCQDGSTEVSLELRKAVGDSSQINSLRNVCIYTLR